MPLWYWYAAGTAFLALTTYMTVRIPELAGEITNGINATEPQLLSSIALSMIGLGCAQIICRSLSRLFMFWPGRDIEARSRIDLFRHTTYLSQKFLDKFGVGDLISRLSNDIGQLRIFYAFGILMLVNLVLLVGFTVSQMWSKNSLLTVLCLSPLVLMVVITKIIMPRMQKFNRANAEDQSALTNQVTEAFVHVQLIKANAAEAAFCERIDQKIQRLYESNIKLIGIRTLLFPLVASLAGLSQIVVIFWGGREVIAGRLTVGDILAFNVYLSILAFPLTSLGIIIAVYQRGKTSLARLNELDAEPVQSRRGDQQVQQQNASKDHDAAVVISQVSFTYPSQSASQDRDPAIKDLSLAIHHKEKLGIYGHVGSGKSTLFHLIARLYDPDQGSILLNGIDAAMIAPQALRKQVNYAMQVPHLFSDSIRANLSFGLSKEPSMEELIVAAKKSCIYDEIMQFSDAWDTQVGEMGVRLSGGQKQRLALARLFLRDASIWLLDDVLSAVDAKTEAHILSHIFALDRTLVIASQRPKPLELCDRVLYMQNGKVIDEGSFRYLVGRYPEIQGDMQPHET